MLFLPVYSDCTGHLCRGCPLQSQPIPAAVFEANALPNEEESSQGSTAGDMEERRVVASDPLISAVERHMRISAFRLAHVFASVDMFDTCISCYQFFQMRRYQ